MVSEHFLAKSIKPSLIALSVSGAIFIYYALISLGSPQIELAISMLISLVILAIALMFQIWGKLSKLQGKLQQS